MSDREELAAAIHEQRRRRAPLTISLGYYDLDPEDQGALLAIADDVLAALGIPAATLAGLRDGTMVAVPVENTDEIRRAVWLAQYRHANARSNTPQPDAQCVALAEERVQSDTQRASDRAAWAAMIAAAQEAGR